MRETKSYICLALFAPYILPLTSATLCLEDWKFNVGACDYDTLKAALQDVLPSDCPHDATIELQEALGASTEREVQRTIANGCSEGDLPWREITKEGDVFDKEYFDGGTSFNDERESKDEFGLKEHNLKATAGVKIRDVNDVISESQGISFPNYMSNFEDCELRTVLCCFVQDRQANDNNGNCATPYDENCVDSDPADNTDICYVDMERAPISSRTAAGFAIFEEEEEGDSHCHGFAWADDPSDKSARYKGNNLFYVSLYDHFYQRGYTRNVPGAPMCGCLEKMPVVTRSDCTQIDVDEDVELKFEGGNFDVTFNNVEIDFNSCQAPNNNNDLEAYYERITSEGKANEEELKEVQTHLVGETYCREAIDSFLDVKNLRKKPACRFGDPETCGCEEVLQTDYRGYLNTTFSGRVCQRWDEQSPHSHSRTRRNFPNEGLN